MKKKPWEIIHEDEDIIVVNKSAGLLSIPDRFGHEHLDLFTSLASTREEVFVVHRLDKFTSGIMIYAKNAEAHSILNKAFENQEVEKCYWAYTEGRLPINEATIDAPIEKSAHHQGQVKIGKSGKPSQTIIKSLKKWTAFTKLACYPKTGRLHQIRVHLQHFGYPLIIDPQYGNNKQFFISSIKRKKFNLKKESTERPLLARQTLHAYAITFKHPKNGKIVSFSADIPKDLRALENQLNKWAKIAEVEVN